MRLPGKQFIKFALVGVSCTAIDLGLFWIARYGIKIGDDSLIMAVGKPLSSNVQRAESLGSFLVKSLTYSAGIFNGYYWNNAWTFDAQGSGSTKRKLSIYWIVSLIGLLVNAIIYGIMVRVLPLTDKPKTLVALLLATLCATLWTYTAHRRYTFASDVRVLASE